MILIIDFGSQTAHLIGRRLRDLGVTAAYADPADALAAIRDRKPSGIIFSGGPASVYEPEAPSIDPEVFGLGIPILGICYGLQLTARLMEGDVRQGAVREYGPARISKDRSVLFEGIPAGDMVVWMSHGDEVAALPPGFSSIASTGNIPYAAIEHPEARIYGVQFHPEVRHTEHGTKILENFACRVCGETLSPIVLDPEAIIRSLKETVGDRSVICAVSGGVDSTVAAYLLGKAIGKRLIPVYVESGLMRPGTLERVRMIFTQLIHADLVVIKAEKRFLDTLKGVEDPEEKRKRIGKLYVDIFEEEAARHPEVSFLGQGTIYSDVIESKGSTHASRIKSHHNVGGLPERMRLALIEPLRSYYKDEVRTLGMKAGLPRDIVWEHPFPGPGYAVRIRGEMTPKRLKQEIAADGIVVEELRKAGLYGKLFQCFAVMTGAFSTAVKGDARVFAEVVGIRAYESDDVMTGAWADIPYPVLSAIATRIVNEVPDVSRVVYDITTKPPATMEWE